MLTTRILTEFLGSFFFIGTIIATSEPIPAAVALLAAIYFGGKFSGGHFNPAVSTAFLAQGTISPVTWISYVIAQILGGLVAFFWIRYAARTERVVITAAKM
jgi:glycerol uptake facilitator-like aquaporin